MCMTVSLPWSTGLFCGNIENKQKQVILSKIFMLLMIRMCKKRKDNKEIKIYANFTLKPIERWIH